MKTMIAVPCMRTILTPCFTAIWTMREFGTVVRATTESTVIHDARDELAKAAIEMGCDRVLWIDSDMTFRPDLMERLSADMDEGREMVTGLYVARKLPITPIIYSEVIYDAEKGTGTAKYYADYPEDTIFEIAGCGFGGCMTSVDLLRRVVAEFGRPFAPVKGLGEDLSFCWRAKQVGAKIWCNSFVKLGHIGNYTYMPEDYQAWREQNEDHD